MTKKKPKSSSSTIAQNKRARFDYEIGDKFEAGLELTGWEVKSMRAGKATLTDTYVLLKDGEAFLLGAHITPLGSASTHFVADPDRTRKLLLHKREIAKLFSVTTQKGHTCIPLALYWKGNRIKCEIALASGKKQYDKRATIKEREWNRDKSRVLKAHNN